MLNSSYVHYMVAAYIFDIQSKDHVSVSYFLKRQKIVVSLKAAVVDI